METIKFDIAIIGGGAAGLVAAKIANAFNFKTCIIEKEKIGGCCTWSGCIPSKALLHAAQVCGEIKNLSALGITLTGEFAINSTGVLDHVRNVVNRVAENHKPEDLEKSGIRILFGTPKFIDETTLEINGKTRIAAKKFIICIGSQPVAPPIKGLDNVDYCTNKEFFALDALPKSILILGGGPIGVEIAFAAQTLGTQTTIIEMTDHILPREDKELVPFIENKLKTKGVDIRTSRQAMEFRKNAANGTIEAVLKDQSGQQEIISAERLLVAIGRRPDFSGLALEKARVEYDKHGIKVNKFLQTTNKNIFACGDVVGPYYFSHVAAYQAAICARNALFKKIVWQKFSDDNISWATFTQPELAHLGLSEEEARKKYNSIKIYKTEYANSDRAYTDNHPDGLVKIITNEKDFVLGAEIVGDLAGEIIQGILIAKANKIHLEKIAKTMFIYPTLSELIYKTARKALIEKKNHPVIGLLLKLLLHR